MSKSINLLPPEEQREAKLFRLNQRVWNFGILVTLSLAVFACLTLVAMAYLSFVLRGTESQIAAKTRLLASLDNERLREEVTKLNKSVKDLRNLQQQHYYWSNAFEALAELIPSTVQLSVLTVERQTGKVEIVGQARDRQEVINLWAKIKSSSFFRNINFPLTNLEKSQNTPFTYTFYVNVERLKTE